MQLHLDTDRALDRQHLEVIATQYPYRQRMQAQWEQQFGQMVWRARLGSPWVDLASRVSLLLTIWKDLAEVLNRVV